MSTNAPQRPPIRTSTMQPGETPAPMRIQSQLPAPTRVLSQPPPTVPVRSRQPAPVLIQTQQPAPPRVQPHRLQNVPLPHAIQPPSPLAVLPPTVPVRPATSANNTMAATGAPALGADPASLDGGWYEMFGYRLRGRTILRPDGRPIKDTYATPISLAIFLHQNRGQWIPADALARREEIAEASVNSAFQYLPKALKITWDKSRPRAKFWGCDVAPTDSKPAPSSHPFVHGGVQLTGTKRKDTETDDERARKKPRVTCDSDIASTNASSSAGLPVLPNAAPYVTVSALLGTTPSLGNGMPRYAGPSQTPMQPVAHLPSHSIASASFGYASAQLLSGNFSALPVSAWPEQPTYSNTNTNATTTNTETTLPGSPSAHAEDVEDQDGLNGFWADKYQDFDNL